MTLIIEVRERDDRRGVFDAHADGRYLVSSPCPFTDGCRVLLAWGYDPEATVVMLATMGEVLTDIERKIFERVTGVRRGCLNTGECLLVFREQRNDRQPMGFGQCFDGVEFFQFLGGDFLESRGNRTFLDIDLFAGKVFKLLHGLRQCLEPNGLPRREERRAESGHFRKWVARRWILSSGVAVALMGDLDLVGPEQGCQD
jgi:hypothetical protein